MTRLDKAIEQVKAIRTADDKYRPWIYDDNGKIRNDLLCGDVLPYLNELKGYEIEMSDDEIFKFINTYTGYNTYNNNANISEHLQYYVDDNTNIIVFSVHLCGDIRGGYSNWFACKFEYDVQPYELESVVQHKFVTEKLCADIDIFSEGYYVYDYKLEDYIGYYYELERNELLKSVEKECVKV